MEITPAVLDNFRQFNILDRIAQFVCNGNFSYYVKTTTGANRASTSVSELEFRARRGKEMFHGMFHGIIRECSKKCFTECSTEMFHAELKQFA